MAAFLSREDFTSADSPVASSVVPLVTSLLTGATALLAAVGIGSGLSVRLLRNSPVLVGVFVVLLFVSIWVASSAKTRRPLILAGAIFLGALGGFTWLAGKVSRAAERPHLVTTAETTASGMVKVSATVKAEGLMTNELIYLVARGHSRVNIDPTTGALLETTTAGENAQKTAVSPPEILVEEAALGPNASGAVDATFTFEVSPALYKDVLVKASRNRVHVRSQPQSGSLYEPECIPRAPADAASAAADLTFSCVRLILPFGATRPSILGSFGLPDDKGQRLLTLTVNAVGVPPSKMVVVDVLANDQPLMHYTLAPDLVGRVQGTPTTHVADDIPKICVIAALVQAVGEASVDAAARQGYCDRSRELPLTVSVAHLGSERVMKADATPGGSAPGTGRRNAQVSPGPRPRS